MCLKSPAESAQVLECELCWHYQASGKLVCDGKLGLGCLPPLWEISCLKSRFLGLTEVWFSIIFETYVLNLSCLSFSLHKAEIACFGAETLIQVSVEYVKASETVCQSGILTLLSWSTCTNTNVWRIPQSWIKRKANIKWEFIQFSMEWNKDAILLS